MQIDPKAKLAARRAYQTEMSNRDMWHADGGPDDTPMDCAINAYLEAAPSPSPSPGVVYALESIAQYCSDTLSGNAEGAPDGKWYRDGFREIRTRAIAALASLSQPAKGEREAMFRVFLKSKDDDAAFTFATKPEMDAFLKANRATPNGWGITDIHEYQCSTAASAFNALSEIEESVK